ncbi:hypothetical protein Tco_0792639 [Tanacetum coccineum]
MHDSDKTTDIHEGFDSDLQSMPDDDLRHVLGFHTANSNDTHKNEVSKSDHIFHDDNAFAERLSLPDHMDYICEEVGSLYSKHGDMESSIVQQVSVEFKSSLPALDSIKSSVWKSIAEELPHVEAQVQMNLYDQLPNLLLKPMYKEFNAFNKLESQRFVLLQKELSKSLHKNIKKSIRIKVRKGMKEVRDKLSCCTSTVATNSQHVHDLRVMFKDMVSLLQAAEVFKKANAEGEKWEKKNPAKEKDSQHPDQTKGEQILGANIVDIVQEEQPSAQVILNEEKSLVVHNPEEKKSEGIISIEDDSDDDDLDKQPLSKRFKILTPIPNLIPLNTFVPKHLLKPEEQQKSLQDVTDQLGNSVPRRIQLKRISDLKEQKDKSEQELRKMFNQVTLKAQAQKWTEHEAKKAKMMKEYKHQISFKANQQLTKTSYVVNPNKEATMNITRGDNPLNLGVHPNFKLKSLSFSEWLEAKKLGLPPPPTLATFRMTTEEKKRKRTQFLKEAFVTEDIRVDGMIRNLIPPPGVVPIEVLVIKKPESGIFFMNRNTDIAFQRESEFHLTLTIQLIRIQNQIKVDSKIADEMFRKMIYVIEARVIVQRLRRLLKRT